MGKYDPEVISAGIYTALQWIKWMKGYLYNMELDSNPLT